VKIIIIQYTQPPRSRLNSVIEIHQEEHAWLSWRMKNNSTMLWLRAIEQAAIHRSARTALSNGEGRMQKLDQFMEERSPTMLRLVSHEADRIRMAKGRSVERGKTRRLSLGRKGKKNRNGKTQNPIWNSFDSIFDSTASPGASEISRHSSLSFTSVTCGVSEGEYLAVVSRFGWGSVTHIDTSTRQLLWRQQQWLLN